MAAAQLGFFFSIIFLLLLTLWAADRRAARCVLCTALLGGLGLHGRSMDSLLPVFNVIISPQTSSLAPAYATPPPPPLQPTTTRQK